MSLANLDDYRWLKVSPEADHLMQCISRVPLELGGGWTFLPRQTDDGLPFISCVREDNETGLLLTPDTRTRRWILMSLATGAIIATDEALSSLLAREVRRFGATLEE